MTEAEDLVLWDAEDEERKRRARWEVEARRKEVEEARLDAALSRLVTAFQRMGAAYCVSQNGPKRLGGSVKRGGGAGTYMIQNAYNPRFSHGF